MPTFTATIWLALALAASIAGNAWQLWHAGVERGSAQGTTDRCVDTNAGERAVIARLTADKAACEAGATVDELQRRTLLADRATAVAALTKAEAAARAAQRQRTDATPECRAWAVTPSCVEPDR
jgi:hypothetical protein